MPGMCRNVLQDAQKRGLEMDTVIAFAMSPIVTLISLIVSIKHSLNRDFRRTHLASNLRCIVPKGVQTHGSVTECAIAGMELSHDFPLDV